MEIKRKNWGFGKLGNCLCFWANGEVIMTVGPDWLFNLCMISIILVVLAFYIIFVAPQMTSSTFEIVGLLVIISNLVFYSLTAFTNPGIVLGVEIELEEGVKGKFMCKFCGVYEDTDTEHCPDCGLCVEELDHHCPVSGKCIAKGNLIYFYAFLVSVVVFFASSVVCLAVMANPKFKNNQ